MKMKEFGPGGRGRASLAPPWIRQWLHKIEMNDDASVSVADPGFFNGGVNQHWYTNILFYKIFAENGVKMKEFRPKAELCVSPALPLDPPLSLIKMKNYLPPCVLLVLDFIFCP